MKRTVGKFPFKLESTKRSWKVSSVFSKFSENWKASFRLENCDAFNSNRSCSISIVISNFIENMPTSTITFQFQLYIPTSALLSNFVSLFGRPRNQIVGTIKRPRRLLFCRILCSHLYDGFIIGYFFGWKEKIYFKQANWKCFHAILSSNIHRSQGPFLETSSHWLTNRMIGISSND